MEKIILFKCSSYVKSHCKSKLQMKHAQVRRKMHKNGPYLKIKRYISLRNIETHRRQTGDLYIAQPEIFQ